MKPVVLVTGAAGGIGRATCVQFGSEGWDVVGIDRHPTGTFPAGIRLETVDVSDPADVARLFDGWGGRFPRLDAVVNNAAVQICKPLVEMSVEEWDETLDSNLRSVFLTARHAFPYLKSSRGCIVNVASVHAQATSPDIAAYAASKGGVVALTKAMAVEFGRDGIRVNAVLPGAVDTPMLRSGLQRPAVVEETPEHRLDRLADRTPLARIGDPAEIARAILFLADGRRSSFITGAALVVDGGATSRLGTE